MRSSGGRLLIALVIVIFSVISYFSSSDFNEITGEKQYVAMSPDEEVALGLQAVPAMSSEYGGFSNDAAKAKRVAGIGKKILANASLANNDYKFDFHTLADQKTVNAFALPGGQVFITEALLDKLSTDDQLAGVLAHEIGHVVGRHGAEHLAKQRLTQGFVMATGVAMEDAGSAQVAAMVGQMVNMKYGRADEIESDALGVRFMTEAGYDPNAMVEVMHILAKSSSGGQPPEFFSSHPNPENRIERIKELIGKQK